MAHANDLTGQRLGRWKVLQRDGTLRGLDAWLCKCDCGTLQRLASDSLRNGGSGGCQHCKEHTQQKPSLTVGKRTMSLAEWSKESGVSVNTIYHRVRAGKTGKEAIAPAGRPAVPDSEVHADTLRIRQAFRESGLTMVELAERLGCSHQNVVEQLSIRRKLQQVTLERYAKALKVKL
jgi:hypothetical protein